MNFKPIKYSADHPIISTLFGMLIVGTLILTLNARVSATSGNDPSSVNPLDEASVTLAISELAERANAANYTFQSELLADNTVTRSEYEAAINQVIECSRQAGLNVTDPEPDWSGALLSYGVIISANPAPGDPGIEAHDQCYDEYGFFVDQAFTLVTFGSRQDRMAETVACIASMGVDTDPMFDTDGNIVATKVLELAFEEFNHCTS